jgi:hypothetical protein
LPNNADNSGVPLETETVVAWVFWMNLVTCAFGVYVAAEKNRSLIAWGILCFFFGLVALVALAGVPVFDEGEYEERVRSSLARARIPEDAVAWSDPLGPPPHEGGRWRPDSSRS